MRDFTIKVSNFYLILLISGFLLVSVLPNLLGISEGSFSISYRVVILGLALFIILKTIFSKNIQSIKIGSFKLFLFFWLLYTIRICYDLFYDPIILSSEKSIADYAQYGFGVVLIPTLAIMLINRNKLNYDKILKWIYTILFLSLLVAIFLRGNTGTDSRTVGDLEIGILLFGQYGASLSILSLFLLIKEKFTIKSFIYIVGFIIGFIAIFISASKSPFLALLAVVTIFIILRYRGFKTAIIIGFFGLFFFYYFLDIISLLNGYFNSSFLDRLLYLIEVGGDPARVSLFKSGLNEFINNPFFGNAMLIQESSFAGSYPHNLIIESFMTTGFFGGILFLGWILKCVLASFKIIKYNLNFAWVGLLFLQFLIFGMFSSNLFSSNLFWGLSVLLILTVKKS
jgi:O-antigen ligase